MIEKILPDALEVLKEALEDHKFLFFTIIITIAISFKLQTIYNFSQSISKQKIKSLEEYINRNCISPETRHVLQEQINSIIFKKATGIRAEKYMQKQIVALHTYAKGILTYRDLRQAQIFFKINCNGQLIIKIMFFEYFMYGLCLVIGIFFNFLAIIFLYPLIFIALTVKLQIYFILLTVFFFFFGMFFLSQTWPISSAKKVKKVIEKYQQELSNQNNIINNQYCLPPQSRNSR